MRVWHNRKKRMLYLTGIQRDSITSHPSHHPSQRKEGKPAKTKLMIR
jgi:hypothetical protein